MVGAIRVIRRLRAASKEVGVYGVAVKLRVVAHIDIPGTVHLNQGHLMRILTFIGRALPPTHRKYPP